MVSFLVFLLGIVTSISVVATSLGHLSVHWKRLQARSRRRGGHEKHTCSPLPVSILKPLKGLDDGLEENLVSWAKQRYTGGFEIIFGAADPLDPALDVALRVKRRFPEVPMTIVAGHSGEGVNPKVATLRSICPVARHDLVLVSDSNVRVDDDLLDALTAEFSSRPIGADFADDNVGLVSNIVVGDGEQSIGALLENLHLNSFVVGAVCGADVIGRHPVVVGKSMLFRQSTLEQVGGWASVADVLGEDYILGRAFTRAGYKVVLSPYVIRTINEEWAGRRFLARHLRWSQTRRWIAPGMFALEPLLNPIPWLLALIYAIETLPFHRGPRLAALPEALLALVFLKIAADLLLVRQLRGRWPSPRAALLVPFKDGCVLALWCLAWVCRTVTWRGSRFRIHAGSVLTAVGAAETISRLPAALRESTQRSKPPRG